MERAGLHGPECRASVPDADRQYSQRPDMARATKQDKPRKRIPRCPCCGQRTMGRVTRTVTTRVRHEGREPIEVTVEDVPAWRCTNPDCKPPHPDDAILEDAEAAERITEACYRALGLLTPAEIRANRERLGLTQQELQEYLGLGSNSLSRWESGRVYQSRSHDMLLRIFFNVVQARTFVYRLRGVWPAACTEKLPRLRKPTDNGSHSAHSRQPITRPDHRQVTRNS